MSPAHAVLLVGAGVLAGVVGSAGGITSLISYPALLAVGIPRLPASMTNSVAIVAIHDPRRRQRDRRRRLHPLRTGRWSAAVLLAVGLFVGSTIGPSVTRRVPEGLMRVVIALAGLGLTVDLWVTRG
jgi:uncharacterized membrane protein YfcA